MRARRKPVRTRATEPEARLFDQAFVGMALLIARVVPGNKNGPGLAAGAVGIAAEAYAMIGRTAAPFTSL
jgi:hypothetical protein